MTNKQALREAAIKAKELGNISRYTKAMVARLEFKEAATPDAVLALLDELDNREKLRAAANRVVNQQDIELQELRQRVAELEQSHTKLRESMATIHNTIRMDGAQTSLAVILNAAKRAYDESATAAGIRTSWEG